MFDHRRLHSSLSGLKANVSLDEVSGVAGESEWMASTGLRVPCVIKNWLHSGGVTSASATSGGLQTNSPHTQLLKLSDMDKLAFLLQEGGIARDSPLEREVQTFDVIKQSPGPRWTFRQWCLYWKERHPAAQTTPMHNGHHPEANHALSPLSPTLSAVAVAQAQSASPASRAAVDAELDSDEEEVDSKAVQRPTTQSIPLTETRNKHRRFMAMTCLCYAGQKPMCELFPVPAELASTDLLSVLHLSHIASQVPQRQAVAVYPTGTVIDFAMRSGGATAWWHVADGGMLYVLAPPSEHNLRMFATWIELRGTQHGLFLQDALEGLIKLQVSAGQSVLLPSGWLVAELALADSLLVGGTLLHAGSLATQLLSWEVEELCEVKPRLRFPMFRHVMWHAAVHYAKVLLGAAGMHALRKQRLPASHAPSTGITVSAAAQASVVGGGSMLLSRTAGRVSVELQGVESRKRPTCVAALLTSDVEEDNNFEYPSQFMGAKRIKLGGLSRQSGHEYRPAAMRRLVAQVAPDEEDGTRAVFPSERDRAQAQVAGPSSPARLPALPTVNIPVDRLPINRIRIKLPPRANAVPEPAALPQQRMGSARQRVSSARFSTGSDDQGCGASTSEGSGTDDGVGTSEGSSGSRGPEGEAERDWQPKQRDEEISSAGGSENDDDYDDVGRGGRGRDDSDSGSEAAGSQMGKGSTRAKQHKPRKQPKKISRKVAKPAFQRAMARKQEAMAQPSAIYTASTAAAPQQQRRRTVADYEAGTGWQQTAGSGHAAGMRVDDRPGNRAGTENVGLGTITGVVFNRLQPRHQTENAQPSAIEDELLDTDIGSMPGTEGIAVSRDQLTPTCVQVGGSGRAPAAGRVRRVVSSDEEIDADCAVAGRSPINTLPASTRQEASGFAHAQVAHVGRLKLKLGGLPSSSKPTPTPTPCPPSQLLSVPNPKPPSDLASVATVSLPAPKLIIKLHGLLATSETVHVSASATAQAVPHAAPKLTIKLPGLAKRVVVIPQSDGAADDEMEDILCSNIAPCGLPSSNNTHLDAASGGQAQTGITEAHAQQPLASQPSNLGRAAGTDSMLGAGKVEKESQPMNQISPAAACTQCNHTAADELMIESQTQVEVLLTPMNLGLQQLDPAPHHPDLQQPAATSNPALTQPAGSSHRDLHQPAGISNPDLMQAARSRDPEFQQPAGSSGLDFREPAETSNPDMHSHTACVRHPEWLPPPPPLPALPTPSPQPAPNFSPAGREDPSAKQLLPNPVPKQPKVVKRTANYVPPASQVANLVALGAGRERKRAGEPIHRPGGLLSPRTHNKADPSLSVRKPVESSVNPLTKAALQQLVQSAAMHTAIPASSFTLTPPSFSTPAMPQYSTASPTAKTSLPEAPPVPSAALVALAEPSWSEPHTLRSSREESRSHPSPTLIQDPQKQDSQQIPDAHRHPPVHDTTRDPTLRSFQTQAHTPGIRQVEDTLISSVEQQAAMGSCEKAVICKTEPQVPQAPRPQASGPNPSLLITGQMAAPLHRPEHPPSSSKPTTSVESKADVTAVTAPSPPARLTDLLSSWEIEGIPHLAATLRGWLGSSPFPDELPFSIRDPGLLLEQLEEAIAALPTHFGLQSRTCQVLPITTANAAQPGHCQPTCHEATGVTSNQSLKSGPVASPLPSVQRGATSVSGGVLHGLSDTCTSLGERRLPLCAGGAPTNLTGQPRGPEVMMARPGRPHKWLRFCTEAEVPEAWRACMARSPKASNMAMPSDTAEEMGETDPLTDSLPVGSLQKSAPRVPGVMHVSAGRQTEAGRSGMNGGGKHRSKAASQLRRTLGL